MKLKESHRRGRVHTFKAYLAILVCFNTKAVHIELVTSLSTEAFLAHCGGLREAAVKVAKQRLNAVTQGLTLTFEESYTLLTEIEAVMNSRPLTLLSSDPASLEVLTPAHFLINDSSIQPVQPELLDIPDNRLSRWQLLQKVRQDFWKRWSLKYLQELQKRSKWCSGSDSISTGAMVLLMEDSTSPLQWNLGRVMEVHPSNDGIVRKVTVKTQTGLFVRSVRKLCPLPMDSQFQNS
ncbi:uncharacterized protein LOC122503261 [Leptopilina heterotoma]|uniref:uncharacterized protein LOC122503261 n=1 Tax=Leptopilina heterotoma TaxID=63436 RepID=UPI001CA8CBC9|nr:uncharacterized protein LOC122503261 [Leptopilina heterotoma]